MNLMIILLLACVISHVVMFNRSDDELRKQRLVVALSMVACSLVLLVAGILVGLDGKSGMKWLAIALVYAPVYMSISSYWVYRHWPRNKS